MKKSFLHSLFGKGSLFSRFFLSLNERKILRVGSVPKHVAIIMDGNRRWEVKKKNALENWSQKGHEQGAQALFNIIPEAKKIGISSLTLFAFSTENWKRSPEEISLIFTLITEYLKEQIPYMIKEGIRIRYIGDYSNLPQPLIQTVTEAMEATQHMNGFDLNLAINYGAKNELVRAFAKIHDDLSCKKLEKSTIDENLVSSYLDTRDMEEPELLIRTGGEMRISNFLLWQIAYTELYFTKTLWPDFSSKDLLKAVISFQKRIRRRGK